MADYQIAWKASTKTATVQSKGDALPSGATKIAEFTDAQIITRYGPGADDVFFLPVRDALYTVGQLNMQEVTIAVDTDYIALLSIAISPGTVTLAPAATQQLTVAKTPSDASNGAIATWVSSDPTKATVSATGLVTAVAAGTTTITATSVDGARVATRTVTVTS